MSTSAQIATLVILGTVIAVLGLQVAAARAPMTGPAALIGILPILVAS